MKMHEILMCSTKCCYTKSLFTKGDLEKARSNWRNAPDVQLVLWLEGVIEILFFLIDSNANDLRSASKSTDCANFALDPRGSA